MYQTIQVHAFPSDFTEVCTVINELCLSESLEAILQNWNIQVRTLDEDAFKEVLEIIEYHGDLVLTHQTKCAKALIIAKNSSIYPQLRYWILHGVLAFHVFQQCIESFPLHDQKSISDDAFDAIASLHTQFLLGVAHQIAFGEFPEYGEQVVKHCKHQVTQYLNHHRRHRFWQQFTDCECKQCLMVHLGQEMTLVHLKVALSRAGHRDAFNDLQGSCRELKDLREERYMKIVEKHGLRKTCEALVKTPAIRPFFDLFNTMVRRLFYPELVNRN